MNIRILGAGYAGLIAGAMLRHRPNVTILEKQPSLPLNHVAVLRFRTTAVSDALCIPFQRVKIIQHAEPWKNPIRDSLAYSYKVSGEYTLDRSITRLQDGLLDRWVPPRNFRQQLGRMSPAIHFGLEIKEWDMNTTETVATISTLPMPALMRLLGWSPYSDFDSLYRSSLHVVQDVKGIPMNAHGSVYIPDLTRTFARMSITRDRIVGEAAHYEIPESEASALMAEFRSEAYVCFGVSEKSLGNPSSLPLRNGLPIYLRKYAKILPMDERERKEFIMWASKRHRVYSLGRFATWRPTLLLDDIVKDVRQILRMIDGSLDLPYEQVKR